ncbi:hypothetical protein [Schnuerera sp.]|uniref:hypothetical protein n=1 Tax=Schnuerera sp. TaxID=2794844 RepID=UPI002C8F27E9|nr:hypothetical protein [Schnuerera sp.]HSH36292.1 hypothetical protein [Schnuerera sp.]
MAYIKQKLLLISDSYNNIHLFRLLKGNIVRYHFDYATKDYKELIIGKEVSLEYDGSIDNKDTIYIIHQDRTFELILTLIKKNGEIERIKLTEEPIFEIYFLNLIMDLDKPHIFYFILLSEPEEKYRIYHHYFTGEEWKTNIVDEVKARELLNPLKVFKTSEEIILAYYNKFKDEQIYIKKFNLDEKEWKEKIRLTNHEKNKLFLDFMVKDSKLHLTYCQFEEGNLVIKYERFNYDDNLVEREIEQTISNPENPQDPTLIYYEDKLWLVWIEYDNVLSRYSEDLGNSWSPIYLWKESKGNNIVRYKYFNQGDEGFIINNSFGNFNPNISFVGFGSTEKTVEIPLKKKIFQTFSKKIPKF